MKHKKLKRKYNKLLDLVVSLSLSLAAAEQQKVVKFVYTYVPRNNA